MKRCPACNSIFKEDDLKFCTKDGSTLKRVTPLDLQKTLRKLSGSSDNPNRTRNLKKLGDKSEHTLNKIFFLYSDLVEQMAQLIHNSELRVGILVDSEFSERRRRCFWEDLFNSDSSKWPVQAATNENPSSQATYQLISVPERVSVNNPLPRYIDLQDYDVLICNRDVFNEDIWFYANITRIFIERVAGGGFLKEWVSDGRTLIVDPQCSHWILHQNYYDALNIPGIRINSELNIRKPRAPRQGVKKSTPKLFSINSSEHPFLVGCREYFELSKLMIGETPIWDPSRWFPHWYKSRWAKRESIGMRATTGYFTGHKGFKSLLSSEEGSVLIVKNEGAGTYVLSAAYLPILEPSRLILNILYSAAITKILRSNEIKLSTIVKAREAFLLLKNQDLLFTTLAKEEGVDLEPIIRRIMNSGVPEDAIIAILNSLLG